MFRDTSQQAYTQSVGTSSTNSAIVDTRSPTPNDVNYNIGRFWVNTAQTSLWYLNSQSNITGTLQSLWELISVGSVLVSLSDTGNTPVFPSSNVSTPPDNIQLIGGSGISVVAGTNKLTISLSGGGSAVETLTGNTGGAINPVANNINTVGTGSITIAGAGSTLTTQLTGLTNHAVLVGAGTATITNVGPTATAGQILQSSGAAADPAFSTATYPSTTTINQLLYSSSANVISGLATANNGTLVTSSGGVPSILAGPGTTGNILQSNAAAAPSFSTATYPSTTTINQILYSSSNNVVGQITAVNNGTLISGTTGIPSLLANGTTGQILTATTGSPPSWQNNSAANAIITITGDTGGAESALANNFNLLGTANQIRVAGTANTETFSLIGPYTPATYTAHGVLIGEGTSSIVATTVGTNGQVLIGSTAADPVFGTLTSSDSSISFTPGAGTLSLQVTGGTTVGKTITGNTGGALSPTAGNWNILGTGSITTSGSGSTLTTQLTGLTNHAVLVGAGTATITNIAATVNTGAILQNNSGADPSYSTATYPSTTTVSQILYSSATNVVSGLATANRAVLTTGATGVPVLTALASDGQLIIGSTAGAPAAATLTAGTGVTITNASNSITINASGGGMTWTDNSGTFTAVSNHGYFITAAATPTLPASPSEGDEVAFVLDAAAALTITANTGQKIRIGAAISALAGTCASSVQGNSIELVFRTSGSTWFSLSAPEGTWTIT